MQKEQGPQEDLGCTPQNLEKDYFLGFGFGNPEDEPVDVPQSRTEAYFLDFGFDSPRDERGSMVYIPQSPTEAYTIDFGFDNLEDELIELLLYLQKVFSEGSNGSTKFF